MKDLASHVMDITENSITANATVITVDFEADEKKDTLVIKIEDNGKGMSEEMLARVTSPFTTTRTTRRVGLGIPLFKYGAENTGGSFRITSQLKKGTQVCATYVLSNIDRPPVGDLPGVLSTLVICHEDIDFVIKVARNRNVFEFKSEDVKNVLQGVSFSQPEVSTWITQCIKEGIEEIYGGNFE